MAFLYVPNGMHMPAWTPAETGTQFELPPTLQPLAKYKSQLTVLSGLTLNGARALGDGGGDHARSVAAFLTGAHPKKTNGADISNGVSVDQLAASQIGTQTRLPSLELGLEKKCQSRQLRFRVQLCLHFQHVLAIPHLSRCQGSRSGGRI